MCEVTTGQCIYRVFDGPSTAVSVTLMLMDPEAQNEKNSPRDLPSVVVLQRGLEEEAARSRCGDGGNRKGYLSMRLSVKSQD